MRLKHMVIAAMDRLTHPKDITSSSVHPTARIMGGCRVDHSQVGRYTYMGADSRLIHCRLGSFCSLAGGVRIGGGSHAMHFVSTSPVFAQGKNVLGKNFSAHPFDPYKETIIGNDVWIGAGAYVRGGVTIGHGAVIGMGSVVTKDVGPYEVWAGNPARCIKRRFDDETIRALLKLNWWDWPEEEIQKRSRAFDDPQKLLEEMKP